jgi:hypothetical protein
VYQWHHAQACSFLEIFISPLHLNTISSVGKMTRHLHNQHPYWFMSSMGENPRMHISYHNNIDISKGQVDLLWFVTVMMMIIVQMMQMSVTPER